MKAQDTIFSLIQISLVCSIYSYIFILNERKDVYKEISMIRHGARSPNKYTQLDQRLWKDFPPGYLTEKGFQQHQELGSSYNRKNIYDQNQYCSTSNFNFIVSAKPRVLKSFIGFMQGACPNNFKEILTTYFTDNLKKYSTNDAVFKEILGSEFIDTNQADLEIFKMKPDMLFHGHSNEQCPILSEMDDQVLMSEEYILKNKEFLNRSEFVEVYAEMQKATPSLNLADMKINKMKTFFGGYKCNKYQGFSEPKLSKAAEKYLQELFNYKFYDMDNSNIIQQQSALTEIFKWITARLEGEEQVSLYFGHDSNQVAVAAALLEQKIFFPFASKLSFIIRGEYVTIEFENKVQITKICPSNYRCTIKQVKDYLKQYISSNLEQLCKL